MDAPRADRYHLAMETTSASGTPAPDAWRRAFGDVTREHVFEPLRLEGRMPDDLRGTLYRAGPGLFSSFGRKYGHWFDGDGLVTAARFSFGRVEGAMRLVDTGGLREERTKQRALHGAYGTAPPSRFGLFRLLRNDVKNPANTSILCWNGRVFALCEIGKPTEIRGDDLATLGETDLEGTVLRTFSAHPRGVAKNGYVYNLGVRVGLRSELDLFVLRPDGSSGRLCTLPLPHATFVHDFVATENHLVIVVAPMRVALLDMLVQNRSPVDAMRWEPERGALIYVVPLDAPALPIRVHTDAFWAWHFANAYERGREIVVDLVQYPDFASNRWLGELPHGTPSSEANGTFHRAVLDLHKRTWRAEPLWTRSVEFPRIAPGREARAYRYAYVAAHSGHDAARAGPPDRLARVDVETGEVIEARFAAGRYPSEPVFVPRSGATREDDGFVLTLIYDATRHESGVAVLEGSRLEAGPLAIAWFDHHVPLTFHGAWERALG